MRTDEDFVYGDNVFGGEASGLLVVQDFEDEKDTQELENQEGPIRIVQVSKLRENIGDLIRNKISL